VSEENIVVACSRSEQLGCSTYNGLIPHTWSRPACLNKDLQNQHCLTGRGPIPKNSRYLFG